MKSLFTNLITKKLITSIIVIFFLLIYSIDLNAQCAIVTDNTAASGAAPQLSVNTITPLVGYSGCYGFTPGTMTGTTVSVTNCTTTLPLPVDSVNNCGIVSYHWYTSATGGYNDWVLIPGATGKDYTPPSGLTATTWLFVLLKIAVCYLGNYNTEVLL